MDAFRWDASLETWLFKIAGNVWRNALRSRATVKRTALELSLGSLPEEGQELPTIQSLLDPRPVRSSLDDAVATEQVLHLRQAMEKLPNQMRRCLQLRVQQDLKYREIATVMQISIETVKSQLFQARERLKAKLKTQFEIDL